MNSEELRDRTKKFALEIIHLFQKLPKTDEAKIIGRQLLRSATSVAANYRAACRGRSKDEFYAKLCIVVEEADEMLFWLELLKDSKILDNKVIINLYNESEELLYIFSAARKTTKINK